MKRTPNPTVRDTPPREFKNLSLNKIDQIIRNKCGKAVQRDVHGKQSKHSVILLPSAMRELEAFIHWGEQHPNNQDEQQFRGLGHYFVDAGGAATVVVSNIQYVYSASRSKTHAKIISGLDTSIYERLNEELAIINKRASTANTDRDGFELDPFVLYGKKEAVLWGHTHPNLGVFFSQTDLDGHLAPEDTPRISLVCDPHRLEMCAIVGIRKENAQVIIYRNTNTSERLHESMHVDSDKKDDLLALTEAATILIKNGLPGGYMKQRRIWRNKLRWDIRLNLCAQGKPQR